MTTSLTLGDEPGGLTIILNTGYWWTGTITAAKDGVPWNWPTGTVLTLVFDVGVSYPGVIAGADVTWTVPVEQVATIDGHAHIDITYPGSKPFPWVAGRVVRRP